MHVELHAYLWLKLFNFNFNLQILFCEVWLKEVSLVFVDNLLMYILQLYVEITQKE